MWSQKCNTETTKIMLLSPLEQVELYLFQNTPSSVVEHLLKVHWGVGSILHGGPIRLFLVLTSASRLV